MKKSIGTALILLAITAGWSMPAYADTNRGDSSRELSVLSQEFNVTARNGETMRARVDYRVSATYNMTERGNARFPDNRSCHFTGLSRSLIRTITLTRPNGQVQNVGEYRIVLSPPRNQSFTGNGSANNCNSRAGEMDGLLREAVGSAATWQQQIATDRADTRSILDLFGIVTDAS